MSSISIRGVDEQLATLLKEKAASAKKSVNQQILDILRTSLGLTKNKKFTQQYHDIDHLFGKWSEDDFKAIQGKIDTERLVDKELWK